MFGWCVRKGWDSALTYTTVSSPASPDVGLRWPAYISFPDSFAYFSQGHTVSKINQSRELLCFHFNIQIQVLGFVSAMGWQESWQKQARKESALGVSVELTNAAPLVPLTPGKVCVWPVRGGSRKLEFPRGDKWEEQERRWTLNLEHLLAWR